MELTEKQYWDTFWKNIKIPMRVDLKFSNDFNIAQILNTYLTKNAGATAFEVGCAPGKWLIYLAQNFNYRVEGCEYLESAAEKTRENLSICGITNFKIITSDFLNFYPQKQYDIVFSFGFIEHFNDVDYICKKHSDILKPGGILIIGIPKFTGINWLIANFLDKSSKNEILKGHNLYIMNLNYFNTLENKIQCKKIFSNYVGGFEPALFNISKTSPLFWIVFHMINLLLNNRFVRVLNIGFCSGYIISVYKKL